MGESWRGKKASGGWEAMQSVLVCVRSTLWPVLNETDSSKGEVEMSPMVGQALLHGDHVAISSSTWRTTK
jgi:hypothetical protein